MASDFRFSPKFTLIDEKRVEQVLDEWYESEMIFGMPFLELFKTSLDKSDSGINPFQAVNKVRRCYNLVKLFNSSHSVSGDIAEAGVFRGSTARLMVEVMNAGQLNMTDKEIVLFDSFEGLPDLGSEDIPTRYPPDAEGSEPFYRHTPRRFSNTNMELVAGMFADTPSVVLQKGWIPNSFAEHLNRYYSFVHIDVDLYQSTKDCLEYFVPRMNEGGIILCDDYLSLRFPGARIAWDLFCKQNNIQFITLDNYQSAIFF